MTELPFIRNFCIIAHIDHGKSTLADRLLERTGALSDREQVALARRGGQVLDSMELEQERGITIKAHAVRLLHTARDAHSYQLNLIDTPGHVDFSYEVSRALAACEGVLLLVDASQGVEAQTLAHTYLALRHNLEIIPILNKIDLPNARVEETAHEIERLVGLPAAKDLAISAKLGTGVDAVLDAIISRIPAPRGPRAAPLRALIFDSWYDAYRGAIVLVRVVEGVLRPGMRIRLLATGQVYEVEQLGVLTPKPVTVDHLAAGEVGFVSANIRRLADTQVGDTLTEDERPGRSLLSFTQLKPMVFAGLFPASAENYQALRDALEKLALNDSAFHYQPENSAALGFGFRCGFLGRLHMEIVQERLEREFGLRLVSTAPSVRYRILRRDATVVEVDNPAKFPPPGESELIEEPVLDLTIITPAGYLGPILKLCEERRGIQKKFEYITSAGEGGGRVLLIYELPLAELVLDFYDRLKSLSRGYASLDYEPAGYRVAELVKLDILVAGEPVDAFALICHRDAAYARGRALVARLRALIPRQQFDVPIQAAIGARVIARETVKALRKDVTAKLYGGDVTRKRKLLEKQKAGKKRLKRVGKVDIPQEAFMAVLRISTPET
ncbi:MAG: translation elongation factor 4 [Terriglobia bacterium]